VWFDHDLEGGDAWWDTILENIRSAKVFVVGLSDESLNSKPCREELDYALALGRPILPVQVGPLTNLRGNPLARLQIIPYRPDDALSAFEVLAAVDEAAKRDCPLPDPLPPPPPIPYGYLLVLGRQIESTELNLQDQVAVVDQLGRGLDEETDEGVRREILGMLQNLNSKPWRAHKIERQIKALLYAHSPELHAEKDADDDTATGGEPQRGGAESGGMKAPPRTPSPDPGPVPDPAEWFRERIERIHEQKVAAQEATREPPVWQPAPDAASRWIRATADSGAASPGGAVPPPRAPWTTPPTWPPAPPSQGYDSPPQPHAVVTPPAAPPPAESWTRPSVPSPPSYWALSIVAFFLSLLFGGIAMYFSYQVGQHYQAGDVESSRKASRTAKAWGIVGIVVGAIGYLAVLGSANSY
jgi:hypothetical protein